MPESTGLEEEEVGRRGLLFNICILEKISKNKLIFTQRLEVREGNMNNSGKQYFRKRKQKVQRPQSKNMARMFEIEHPCHSQGHDQKYKQKFANHIFKYFKSINQILKYIKIYPNKPSKLPGTLGL